ncbi:leucyl aminopeptidase [Halarcobacter ebronensis]|uniref:Probable cytosol aminopeptidase n=1 Tax=Halarcobacter ebronensis TaxID=1462615 RepID=A0A4Q1AN73_9BACT|nr:leucyl aminopeptidase [Halarcobacter ebronensis]QKF81402.1 leucyl aminopeptidase, peptidase M17 family [Halarcobacter ebronensis]RXK01838.1 leucyl aminopeptidase [Halarcobacter ebronensis]
MKVSLIENDFKNVESELEIFIVDDIENSSDKDILESIGFEEKDESLALLPEIGRIYVGCEDENYESIAIAISTAIRKFKTTKFETAKIELKDMNLKALVEGALLGEYEFTQYKSEKKKSKKQELLICVPKITPEIKKSFEESKIISKAVNKTRDIVNTTPADCYPKIMAQTAKKIAKDNNLECEVFGEKYLAENGMNAMLSVGRASVHESKLIHLSYKPENAKKKVVLVGKGLTYDSGGLSLKPADYMVTMKSDKSGASAVLGIMSAVSKLNLPIEIHGIIGAVENMIGGDAYKPDDVLVARNGKTIEVRNTDAEGRLVLADCLCYAQDEIEDIDYIFDFATLTGACVVGVGEYTIGIMGNNTVLKREVVSNTLEAGEYATTLPFNRFLRKTIKSEIADICNVANTRYGGAITAGLFLDNFINEENKDKWVHFDIAGPAYVEKAWGYNPHGASGAGVRATLQFLKTIE